MQQNIKLLQGVFFAISGIFWLLGMHYFMHNPGGSSLYLPFNMLDWAFVATLAAIGLWAITFTGVISIPRAYYWFLFGFGVLLIPLFAHQHISYMAGLPRMLGIAAGFILLLSLHQLQFSREQRILLVYLLLGAVAVEALFALVQYFILRPGNWIGYNTIINRPYGIFQKDSVLSSFLAMGVAISFYLSCFDSLFDKVLWRRWLVQFVLFASGLLLVVIFSRAGQVGAILVTVAFIFFGHGTKNQKQLLACLVFGVVLGIFCGLELQGGRPASEGYMQNALYRVVYWHHAFEMFLAKPWLGYGYGAFPASFLTTFFSAEGPTGEWFRPEAVKNLDHPHNELFFWLVEGGLVAISGLSMICFGWYKMLQGHSWRHTLALFALPLPLLFHALVEYPFYHSTAHWIALMWLLWFTSAEQDNSVIHTVPFPFLLRSMIVALTIPVVVFMLSGLQTAYLITRFERGGMQDSSLLLRVVNPVPWYSRYMYDVMSMRLNNGLANQNPAEIQAYVDWATEFVRSSPTAAVYYNTSIALFSLNRKHEATEWLTVGKKLFPNDRIFDRLEKSNKP